MPCMYSQPRGVAVNVYRGSKARDMLNVLKAKGVDLGGVDKLAFPKKKKDDWRVYRNKLDIVFSKFIRLRDAWKPCISCGKFSKLQCGHFIKRQYLGTRWNEENCQGQCVHCNYVLQGNDIEFAKGLVKRYGAHIINNLKIKKQFNCGRPSIEWLKLRAEYYRLECENLEAMK